ncbi:MAG: hypothetical protein JNJ46_31120 [Myxococcales bacterium]|nr:hypothetical protein [Myxococcales bacterium]
MGKGESISCIGPHQVQVDGEAIFVSFSGPYLPDEARQLLTLADGLYRKYGAVVLVADVSQLGSMGAETRRVVGTWPFLGIYQTIVYNATKPLRILLDLMSAARRLLGLKNPVQLQLVATHREAVSWLAEQRRLRNPLGDSAPKSIEKSG